jgi:pimeloyl-ACP methyl ester carboxylesterase
MVSLGNKPPVLFFPGGHCTAASDCGWELYTSLGYGIVAFSRPGYGRTGVGALSAAEFIPALQDCCRILGIDVAAAAVGVSFGGMQAIAAAVGLSGLVPRLTLHSCAPSTHSYPDTAQERLGGPVAFSPRAQRLTWATVSTVVKSESGLRAMVGALSTGVRFDERCELPVLGSRETRAAAASAAGSGCRHHPRHVQVVAGEEEPVQA